MEYVVGRNSGVVVGRSRGDFFLYMRNSDNRLNKDTPSQRWVRSGTYGHTFNASTNNPGVHDPTNRFSDGRKQNWGDFIGSKGGGP